MRVVLMGPPGVGKGTQAELMQKVLGVPHVSTGNILRTAMGQVGSPLGEKVRGFVESGRLVPDGLMGDLIGERLERKDAVNGFILDDVLSRLGLSLDRVLMLVVPETEIVKRLSGRRTCPSCGTVFHVESRPPAVPGVCDACGAGLVQRPDDREQVIRDRMKVYTDQTLPVAQAYRAKGILVEIDGLGEVDDVRARLNSGLGRTVGRS